MDAHEKQRALKDRMKKGLKEDVEDEVEEVDETAPPGKKTNKKLWRKLSTGIGASPKNNAAVDTERLKGNSN